MSKPKRDTNKAKGYSTARVLLEFNDIIARQEGLNAISGANVSRLLAEQSDGLTPPREMENGREWRQARRQLWLGKLSGARDVLNKVADSAVLVLAVGAVASVLYVVADPPWNGSPDPRQTPEPTVEITVDPTDIPPALPTSLPSTAE